MPVKPSEKEQEYFLRQEAERLARLQREHLEKTKDQERRKMKELHLLHCPKCGQKMETSNMGGVEIEICPDCRGIYLDDGELTRLLDGSGKGAVFVDALRYFRGILGGA